MGSLSLTSRLVLLAVVFYAVAMPCVPQKKHSQSSFILSYADRAICPSRALLPFALSFLCLNIYNEGRPI